MLSTLMVSQILRTVWEFEIHSQTLSRTMTKWLQRTLQQTLSGQQLQIVLPMGMLTGGTTK